MKRSVERLPKPGVRGGMIASTDCGFGSYAGFKMVADDVVWAKLKALSDGAAIAGERPF